MKLILKLLTAFIVPLCAHTDLDVFIDNPVEIQWHSYQGEYEYMLDIYQLKGSLEKLIYKSSWILENNLSIDLSDEGSYLWKVYIKEKGKRCKDENQCFNIESGYFDFYISPKEDTVEQENIPKKVNKKEDKSKEVLGSSKTNYVAKKEFKKELTKKEIDKVENDPKKEIKNNFCNIKYNIKKKKFKLESCNIEDPKINSSTYYNYKDLYIISSKGSYEDKVKINIKDVVCKNFNLSDPKTWFRCEEVVVDRYEYNVRLKHEVYFSKDKIISPINYIFKNKSFEISTLTPEIPKELIFKGFFSLNHKGIWLDQEIVFKKELSFIEIKRPSENGIYNFPFSQIINVNQWHGCTKYKCPHTGIDFASVKENIYASDNGIVVSKGFDDYYGECNSGGNYLVIDYENGHHMAYMHLEKSYVKKNQKVKKGDLIAISGNSGSQNCQPLGYHLHFELRDSRKQSSHIDPVPYINIDWNLIKTNKSNIYPKRLSGDNPHPTF